TAGEVACGLCHRERDTRRWPCCGFDGRRDDYFTLFEARGLTRQCGHGLVEADCAVSVSSAPRRMEQGVGELPLIAPWIGRGHRHLHAPDAGGDNGTDLQKLESDRAAGGIGELGEPEAE